MQALSATELLSVWERGARQTLSRRALGLLAAASPDMAPDSLARLTVGERDARLFTLRSWLFGPRLLGLAQCPRCGEHVELGLDTEDFLASQEDCSRKEGSFAF